MYLNPTIKRLFKYARAFEKMQRGKKRVSKRKLAYEFVSLICKSRNDLVFLLDENALAMLTRLEQLTLLKILCDIYGEPSTWKNFEGEPIPCNALLKLEKEYLKTFESNNFYDFSYAFRDFHDYLHQTDKHRVDEEIIMLADRPVRKPSLKLRFQWFVEGALGNLKKKYGKSNIEDVIF